MDDSFADMVGADLVDADTVDADAEVTFVLWNLRISGISEQCHKHLCMN